MPLNAGEMDREVTLQQLSESSGSSGFPKATWSTLDTVWAARRDMSSSERFKASQLSAAQFVAWQIYFRDDMDPEAMDVPKQRRLVYQGRIYDIVGATIVGFNDSIELMTLASTKVS